MRIKNTVKNMKIGLFFTTLYLVLNFLGRGVFIRVFGADIAGFNTLIVNLMGFLNIAELGVAMAITYSLYKPLNSKDYSKVNEIMVLFKYYYKNVAKIICFGGIILSLGLNFFVKNQIPLIEAYSYYFLFLCNTIIIYFFIYKQTLIIADQKQYIIVAISNTVKIIKIIVQIGLIYTTKNYLLWIVIELLFNIINLLIINNKANKLYTEVSFKSEDNIEKIKKENIEVLQNMKNAFFHKIAGFVVFQTDGILISLFLNLKQTAMYGNYMMIINGVLSIFISVVGSFTASVGNLVAEENNEKSFSIFKKLYLLDHFMAIILTYTLYNIINEFIVLWVGAEYLFGQAVVFVLMINVYIQITRGAVEKFKDTYGIFWDRFAPIVEGIINLSISYILVQYIGVIGLFIGTLISNVVIILIWKPYIVYKYGFKRKPQEHIKLFLKMIGTAGLAIIIANIVIGRVLSFLVIENLIINFLIASSIKFLGIWIITFIVFLANKEFKEMINMVIGNRKQLRTKVTDTNLG